MYIKNMKLGRKDLAIGLSAGTAVALGTIYGLDKAQILDEKEKLPESPQIITKTEVKEDAKTIEENKALKQQAATQQSLISELTNDLTQADKTRADLQDENSSLKTALNDALGRLLDNQKEISSLKDLLWVSNTTVDDLDDVIDDMVEENGRLNDELYTKEDEITKLRREMDKLQSELKKRDWIARYQEDDAKCVAVLVPHVGDSEALDITCDWKEDNLHLGWHRLYNKDSKYNSTKDLYNRRIKDKSKYHDHKYLSNNGS